MTQKKVCLGESRVRSLVAVVREATFAAIVARASGAKFEANFNSGKAGTVPIVGPDIVALTIFIVVAVVIFAIVLIIIITHSILARRTGSHIIACEGPATAIRIAKFIMCSTIIVALSSLIALIGVMWMPFRIVTAIETGGTRSGAGEWCLGERVGECRSSSIDWTVVFVGVMFEDLLYGCGGPCVRIV